MGNQIIITISREYGSGGHEIASILANALNMEMYDRTLIKEIAKEMDMDVEELKKYDEQPRGLVRSRTVRSHSNSMEEILNEKQAEWIRRKADSGESFIVVGRRAKEILSGHPGLISIFITADEDYKVKRIMDDLQMNEEEARAQRIRVDRHRKTYHNRYSDHKWGDSRYYDLILNSSRLGSLGTAALVLFYVNARTRVMDGSINKEQILRNIDILRKVADAIGILEEEEKPVEAVKPEEEKPAEKKPAEEKPAEKKPAEKKPAEKKPAEKKPAEKKPAEKKPAEKKPAEKKN